MTIKALRMDMMKSKKTNPDRAKVLQAILGAAQLVAKEDGNRDANEKDIVTAAKKEVKMAKQSQEAGAPFIACTFEICDEFLPKTMTENETKTAIAAILVDIENPSMKDMGKIMGQLKGEYTDSLDGAIASKLVKEALA